MRKKRAVIVAIVVTAATTLIAVNLLSERRQVEESIETDYGVRDPQFLRSIAGVLGAAPMPGNHVTELVNGDQIFPAMLAAIRGAEQTICFETYIYWSGSVGREFAAALEERARSGVRAHVILDWLGTKIEDQLIEDMRDAGVELELYNPLPWYVISRMSSRTHRKILVVDGSVAFTGGVGIADDWLGNADSVDHWRDTHFRIEGPVVAEMQAAFDEHWLQVSGRVLEGADYFPRLDAAGAAFAQVVNSGPSEGRDKMRLLFLLSIAAARDSILISNAYLIPDDLSLDALVAAAERGVKIVIIVPGPVTDARIVERASKSRWGRLLEAGAQIFEYQPTLYHCKVMIIDGAWCSVGSTNFDNRSFALNAETSLNVLDETFARRQVEVFEDDLRHSQRVTLEEWTSRPWTEKVGDRLAGLLRWQL